MKINKITTKLINIFRKPVEKQAEKSVVLEIPPDSVHLSTKSKPVLPFDAKARLSNLGIEEESIEKILKTVKGNKDHYQKIVRMIKAGFEPDIAAECFNASKKYWGQLNVPLYNTAFVLKNSGIEQKYIPLLINEFKLPNGKFDIEAYKHFERIRKRSIYQNTLPDYPGSKEREEMINKIVYEKIKEIKNTQDTRKTFLVFG